jgi:hypothetical protein
LQLNLPPGRALFWMGLGFTILAGVRLVWPKGCMAEISRVEWQEPGSCTQRRTQAKQCQANFEPTAIVARTARRRSCSSLLATGYRPECPATRRDKNRGDKSWRDKRRRDQGWRHVFVCPEIIKVIWLSCFHDSVLKVSCRGSN